MDVHRGRGSRLLRAMRSHFVLLGLSAALVACTAADAQVRGNGSAKTESRTPGDFAAIAVGGAITVDISVGASTSVTVSADANVLPLIRTEVKGGRLVIEPTARYRTSTPVKVAITTPTLTGLSLAGASVGTVAGVDGGRLAADVSGASELTLRGALAQLTLDASGASQIEGRGLTATNATVGASGASQVEVTVKRALTAAASGASRIDYWGGATVTKVVSGASQIRKR